MQRTTDWLLSGPPWVEYRTRVDLLNQSEENPAVRAARQAMGIHPRMKQLVEELGQWPGPVLKSHRSAGLLLHKLVFLADLGFNTGDEGIPGLVQRIYGHQSPEGIFQVVININPRYGGRGENQFAWTLCDAPSVLYALKKFGMAESPALRTATEYLVDLSRENGWPCVVAPELGRFRGPGRKSDPCPYATLLMLKLLAQFPEYLSHDSVKVGIETLLSLWDQRKKRRPYLFAMGRRFTMLRAPLIWYDILHVADVLTRFPLAQNDKRLLKFIQIIRDKADTEGRFTAESIWRDWKDWEFGQKRNPSRWITLITYRILARVKMQSNAL